LPKPEKVASKVIPLLLRRSFYGARDLDLVDIAFKIKPARFWLVTFSRPGTDAPLFAVVLPDGEVLDPRVLIGI
jgi:hypothetical protein